MAVTTTTKTIADYKSDAKPVWCPGCGDFGVLNALYRAFAQLELDPAQTVVCSGIGCSSRTPYFVNAYGYHGVHGRALPTAMGMKLASPELTVVVVGGDGDGLAIGAGHFPHACRRNYDVTYVMMDNFIYGLTKGQASPTTHQGHVTKTTPEGPQELPLDPAVIAITFGATFVARCFSGQPAEMAATISQAIQHPGFSFIQVLSPCTTFYDTFQLCRETTSPLELGAHDTSNPREALDVAMEQQPIRLGVLYHNPQPAVQLRGKAKTERASRLERLQAVDALFEKYV